MSPASPEDAIITKTMESARSEQASSPGRHVVDQIRWFEPFGVTKHRAILALREASFFRARFWVRVLVVAIVCLGGLVGWATLTYSNLVVPWSKIALVLTLSPLILVAYAAVMLMIPRLITVRRDVILIQAGSNLARIERSRMISSEIEQPKDGTPLLRVRFYSRRGVETHSEIAIAPAVDIDALGALLGINNPLHAG